MGRLATSIPPLGIVDRLARIEPFAAEFTALSDHKTRKKMIGQAWPGRASPEGAAAWATRCVAANQGEKDNADPRDRQRDEYDGCDGYGDLSFGNHVFPETSF